MELNPTVFLINKQTRFHGILLFGFVEEGSWTLEQEQFPQFTLPGYV